MGAEPRLRSLQLTTAAVQYGAPLALRGEHLPTAHSAFRATVNGAPVAVDSVIGDQVWLQLPSGSASCATSRVALTVDAPGWTFREDVVVAPALRVVLPVGESVIVPGTEEARCVDLMGTVADSARYVFTVMNTVPDASQVSSYSLAGQGRAATAARQGLVTADGTVQRLRVGSVPPGADAPVPVGMMGDVAPQASAHLARLNAQRLPTLATAHPTAHPSTNTAMRWQVGETVRQRVATGACSSSQPVDARVVYAGSSVVLLEDVAAPMAGRMDMWFALIGEEYERVMLPLVQQHLGNPLARNAALDGDQRVTLLFTPAVNTAMPGTAAFVNACNLYPRSSMPGSSADEVIYVRVPGAGELPADWLRALRSTLVHETKHLASFAERLSRGRDFEEPWLEEATARLAEELYSRTFRGGGQWLGRTTFASSVHCELVWCDERPLVMYKHFAVLHQFLRNPAALSPLGPTSATDATPYASGWSLVRSALDATGGDESRLIRALVRGDAGVGVAALAGITGTSSADLLDRWMADQLDAETGRSAGTALRSWDSGSVWQGLAGMFPGVFRSAPLRAAQLSAGTWEQAGTVRGFSAAFAVLDGVVAEPQRVMLRSDARGALRLRITRVE